jgi:RNA polymerase sigma-70 factor (ECF subfamily)
MRLVTSNEVAQDLVQDAFLRLHTRFGEVERPRPWLYRTVHNLAMNHHRRRRHERAAGETDVGKGQPEDGEASTDLMPDEHLERLEAIGLARLQIERLEAREREVLLLRFEEDLSYRQISERTGLTISHVGYLLHQTLKAISGELEKAGILR